MKSLHFVFAFARDYVKVIAIAVVSMIALVGIQLLAPWVIRQLIGALTTQGPNPQTMALVGRLAGILLAVYVVRGFLQYASNYAAHIAGWGVVAASRRHIYEHVQRLSLRFKGNASQMAPSRWQRRPSELFAFPPAVILAEAAARRHPARAAGGLTREHRWTRIGADEHGSGTISACSYRRKSVGIGVHLCSFVYPAVPHCD